MSHTLPPARHRHFVAAPLTAVLLLFIGAVSAAAPVGAEYVHPRGSGIVNSDGQDLPFSTPAGPRGLLGEHSEIALAKDGSLELRRGSLFALADDGLMIDAGLGLWAQTIDGMVFVLRSDEAALVASVRGPALAVTPEKTWILPQGYQLRIDAAGTAKRSRIPEEWLTDQALRSNMIPASTPNAYDQLVLTGDDVTASLVEDTGPLRRRLLTALSLGTSLERLDDVAVTQVVSAIVHDPEAADDLPFAIPALAASVMKPLPDELFQGWVQSVLRLATTDAMAAQAIVLDTAVSLPRVFEDAGYPRQAILWRSALASVSEVLSPLLAGEGLDTFDEQISQALHAVSYFAAETLTSEAETVVRKYSDAEVVSLTRTVLHSHHVLFTAATDITPDTNRADCARVSGVFIAENGQDTAYAFSYCPGTERVAGIERAGTPLPNELTASAFFAH